MSKRQEFRERRRRRERNQRLAGIGLIVGGALLIAFLLIWPNLKPIEAPADFTALNRPQTSESSVGDPNAPLQLIEYSDFQCPYCKRFADETEQQILDAYIATGKVYFTYRSMGNWVSQNMRQGDTESLDSAAAAYCAGDQGLFWEYHDALYANWNGEGQGAFSPRRLTAIAELVGLDLRAFQDCFNNGKYEDRAQQDYQDGLAAGVQGTPSFVLIYQVAGETRTRFIEGALPFSSFQAEFDAALAEMGQ